MRRLLSRFPTSTLMGLAFTIPAMVIAGVLLSYNTRVARRFLADEGVRYGEILTDQLLSASQRFLRLGSVAAVQEMIEDTGSKRSVVHVALIGSDGRVIASSRRDWIGQPDSVIPDADYSEVSFAARATFHPQHRLVDGGKRIVLVSPLLIQGTSPILTGSRGTLYLRVDQERKLREIHATILRRGTVSAAAILAFSLLLLAWVRMILGRPILGVAAFLRAFAKGADAAPPRRAGPREVSQLIDDVGRMAEDLRTKQQALVVAETRQRRLREGAYDAILTVDPGSGRLLEANLMFCRLFGYAPEEIAALTLADLHPPEDRARLMVAYREAASLAHKDFHEVPCVRKDGTRFFVDIRGGPIALEDRTVMEWIVRDRTERRRLEDQLRQAQKLESVATLAGGMAHDFNNLLTGILGYTRLVLARLQPDDPLRRQMATIERSALRAAELTAQLQTFSRRAASRPAPADLNAVVAPVVEALRAELPSAVTLRVRSEEGLWTTAVDSAQVQQALRQLCQNAREAMSGRGTLTIATSNRTLTAADCHDNLEARPGRFVTLSVEDDGRGIDPAIRARIFEPFFTTKEAGAGAGLGLSMVYGSVKGHDGWVEVTGEPGRGARFTLHLPEWDPAAAAERVAMESPAAVLARLAGVEAVPEPSARPAKRGAPGRAARPAPQRTILAVDDESTVLALARDILELHGHRVLTARNGHEALRLYGENRVDLVVLDLTMPVMGGHECLREILKIDPDARVVISSGFSVDSTVNDVLRDGAVDYVQKPYDIDVLARVVRQALERPPRGAAAGRR